ncbi:MAG: hypothetical protein NVS3B12_27170 [Acidimicrobiales bacterium]
MRRPPRRTSWVRRDEAGLSLIVIALSMTGIMGVASLSIDGGRMFTARRQAQNAGDAGAQAGAEALFAYQYAAATNATRTPGDVNAAVSAKVLQNGSSTEVCTLVDSLGNDLVPCATATDADLIAAAGVRARSTITRSTALAGVMGVNSFTAAATATAQIQPLVATGSPFIICGAANTGWNILSNTNQILPSASNLINVPIESSQVPTCGAGSAAFKGKAAPTPGLATAGGYWAPAQPGNGYKGTTANRIAGLNPCPTDISTLASGATCGLIMPVASGAKGTGVNTTMLIVTFAIFNITANQGGNPRYSGTYVAPASLATLGQGAYGAKCATGNQICLVKLTS